MEIRNLISFICVAEHSNFTKAAQQLGYSQSTVSFQIKQLEDELGCLLFERINHTVHLTEKGGELLLYAHKLVDLTDEFKQNFVADGEVEGFVHIVTPDSVCEMMMSANYDDFYKHYPKIRLKFSSADTDDMFRILDHNEADVIFTLDSHVYQKDYVIAKEERIGMHFVAGASSPLAQKKGLSVKDIANEPFLLTEKRMGYRKVFDDMLDKRSIDITPVLEIGRTDIITQALEKGIGVSFLPDFVTAKKVEEGKLKYIDVTDFETEIWKQLIHHKNKWISRHLEAFLNYVKTHEFEDKGL